MLYGSYLYLQSHSRQVTTLQFITCFYTPDVILNYQTNDVKALKIMRVNSKFVSKPLICQKFHYTLNLLLYHHVNHSEIILVLQYNGADITVYCTTLYT